YCRRFVLKLGSVRSHLCGETSAVDIICDIIAGDFRSRTVAFPTGISATSGTAPGSSRQLHLFELRFLVLTVSSLPRARRSASEAQDVQVQIFPVGRAFSAVPIF